MDETPSLPHACRRIAVRLTDEEYVQLKQEAQDYGYDLSSLLRLRIFGKLKGMRITRRPSADMMILGEIVGRLAALVAELNKIGSNLNQIARRLNQSSRDLFGLDGALRALEAWGPKLNKCLGLIDAAVMGRRTTTTEPKEDDHEQ